MQLSEKIVITNSATKSVTLLDLTIQKHATVNGMKEVIITAPLWIVNMTGRTLVYRQVSERYSECIYN